jgi:hypothetical protein
MKAILQQNNKIYRKLTHKYINSARSFRKLTSCQDKWPINIVNKTLSY